MAADDRGALLYAYRPIPANPMTVAVLLLVLIVTFVIGPIAAGPEGLWPLGGLCFVPLGLVLGAIAVFKPSPTFVFEEGIEISLPWWRRLAGERRYYRWSEIRDVYPRSYEVAGSFLSPFASSAGTLVHTGLGLETNDGGRLLLPLTPGSIRAFRAEAPGNVEAMAGIPGPISPPGGPPGGPPESLSEGEGLGVPARARGALRPV